MFSLIAAQPLLPIVSPPRHNVHHTSRHLLAHSRHVTTSPCARNRVSNKQAQLLSDPDCLCFGLPKQQRRTQQLAATSLGPSHLHAPLLAVSTRHDLSLCRNSHLHEQSQLSISALSNVFARPGPRPCSFATSLRHIVHPHVPTPLRSHS